MNVSNRVILLGILLLAMLPAHALADLVINRYSCYITSPRGPYGVYQYQTLSGPFYAGTEVCLGPHYFEIPAPPFAVLVVCAFPVLGLFALCLRGFLSPPGATIVLEATAGRHVFGVLDAPRPPRLSTGVIY